MQKMIEVVINNVSSMITEEAFNDYKNNPNYMVISENGKYKILQRMYG